MSAGSSADKFINEIKKKKIIESIENIP
jgi:hypothetical protein